MLQGDTKMRLQILIAALALALTVTPAFADPGQGQGQAHGRDRSCRDGKGNWHYCFVPDNDPPDVDPPDVDLVPIYQIVSNLGTVQRGKTISVQADCSPDFYATGGSFKTNTPINGVMIPQRVYVTGVAPTFPAGMDETNSAPTGEIVTVINSSMRPVEVTAYATCTAMTTP
jgi:hypothetical protein